MIFEVPDKEKATKWLQEHNCKFKHPNKVGAIGGRISYQFTPTSLGLIAVIKCTCGEKCDVSNYDEW
jgi:hypothetical protein